MPNFIQDRIKKLLVSLQEKDLGIPLVGDLKGLYSIHFERNKYRIIYSKDEHSLSILVLYVGKRTNSFYETYRKNK